MDLSQETAHDTAVLPGLVLKWAWRPAQSRGAAPKGSSVPAIHLSSGWSRPVTA